MPHRDAMLLELSRILKPSGRFVFPTWVARQPGKGPPFPADYRPLLEAAVDSTRKLGMLRSLGADEVTI